MRMYTMGKQQLLLLLAVMLVCEALFVVVGLTGPPMASSLSRRASESSEPWRTGSFRLRTPHISRYTQQLWVLALLEVEQAADVAYQSRLRFSARLAALSEDEERRQVFQTGNRSQSLVCQARRCQQLILIHLVSIDWHHYEIQVNIQDFPALNSKLNIQDVVFYVSAGTLRVECTVGYNEGLCLQFKGYNPAFSQLELLVRLLLAALALGATIWFLESLRGFPYACWSLEQRWTSWLLPLLLLYDNPVFALSLVWSSWVPRVLDSLFQVSFVAALLLFWLCLFHGLRDVGRSWMWFWGPKLGLVGLMWGAALSLETWERVNEAGDPGWYADHLSQTQMTRVRTFVLGSGSLYGVYLAFLVVRAYAELRNLPHFNVRLKAVTGVVLVVSAWVLGWSASRWGITPGLEDAITASVGRGATSSVAFTSTLAMLNLLPLMLAFLYSPNPHVPPEMFFKDNPGITLLQDSEDELLYNKLGCFFCHGCPVPI